MKNASERYSARHQRDLEDEELMTPDDYWNSQPAPVREMRTMSGAANRYNKAVELSKAGYTCDRAIHVDQAMDPATCMEVRENNGYTWVPAFDQPPLPTAPNCPVPGLPPYDAENPPEGSIKVSRLKADYPPQPDIPPAPVPLTPIGDPYPMPDGSIVNLPGPGLVNAYEGLEVQWEGVNYYTHYDARNQMPIPQTYLTKLIA